jgi:putative inorganic carbon (HCO3(-)) transporter
LAGPFRLPWVILGGWMLVGSFVSPSPDLTLPKLSGMVLGMLVLRAVLLTATTAARVWVLTAAYVLAGTGMVVGGLLAGPRWLNKFAVLYDLDGKIPRILLGFPGAESGVNSTALGGSTLWLLPIATVLFLSGLGMARRAVQQGTGRTVAFLATLSCAIASLASCFVLLLSQARGAWLTVLVVGLLVLAIRLRATFLLCAFGAVSGLAARVWLGPWSLARVLGPERPFIWSLAARDIRAHPITGVGLGAFRMVAGSAPEVGVVKPFFVAHAHNIFIQVALDVGIPGLVAYLALLGLATHMMYQVLRHDTDSNEKALCLGLWANLAAIHVFGLADAIALGTKVGIFLWWNLGLIAALYGVARRRWAPVSRRPSGWMHP